MKCSKNVCITREEESILYFVVVIYSVTLEVLQPKGVIDHTKFLKKGFLTDEKNFSLKKLSYCEKIKLDKGFILGVTLLMAL